jgi:hypothetical protein
MNTKRISAAVAAAALVVLGSATGAFAGYEDPSITLEVNPTSLVGGQTFTGTATATVNCSAWEITFDGPSSESPKTGSGSSIDFTWSTNEVSEITPGAFHAKCTYDDSQLRASALQDLTTSTDVTVNPTEVSPPTDGTGTGGFGGLADTGGPHLWLAIGGGALVLVGAGAVLRSRRISA